MAVENPVDVITGAWFGIAPSGYGENVHSLIQKEIVDPDGRRAITYPALVYQSTGVARALETPDGRHDQEVEEFQLDFRARTYRQARMLAAAFRDETDGVRIDWSIDQDDVGLDLIIGTGGQMVPRRVVRVLLPYRREFG